MLRLCFSIAILGLFCAAPALPQQPDRDEGAVIMLPEPDRDGGMPLMQTLNQRRSSRSFADRPLPMQTLSNLLWAAFGINREDSGKRTAPSSEMLLEIDIYVTTAEGSFLYLAEDHALRKLGDEDIRVFTGKQEFVKDAAVNLVYVSDFSRYPPGRDPSKEALKHRISRTHCGFIGQNVYLFCASEGLNTVFRGWMDAEEIHDVLDLREDQHVMYTQSVGPAPSPPQ